MIAQCDAPTANPDDTLSEIARAVPRIATRVSQPSDRNTVLDCSLKSSKIMILDDEAYNVLVVKKFLANQGYEHILTSTDAIRAIELIRQNMPDLILLDIMMPEVSGIDILTQMKRDPELATIPVIILTASSNPTVRAQALELGATDFLPMPVESGELVLRVRNVLAAKAHFDHLASYSLQLEKEVEARTRELAQSRRQIITCLARAAEFRDDDTGEHVVRVGKYAAIIADELGFDGKFVESMELAAQLHDVGKIAIPDAILHKPGKLDPDEFSFMRKHCSFGEQIIDCLPESDWKLLRKHTEAGARMLRVKSSSVLALAMRIALTHHERWDGTGYPLGLEGEDIPIEGRITAVADVYDALSSERPYKKAFPRDKCFSILEEGRGSHFDTKVLDAFFCRFEDIVETQLRYSDRASTT